MLYLRADFLVRVKQHSELCCNRRQAESNVKLALNIAEARRRKTKSNLTKKDAEERVKDQKVKMQHTTMLCSSVSDSLSVTGLDDIGYGQDDATGLEADTRKENGWGTGW